MGPWKNSFSISVDSCTAAPTEGTVVYQLLDSNEKLFDGKGSALQCALTALILAVAYD